MESWYIFPVLVFCNKKNLATLVALFPNRQAPNFVPPTWTGFAAVLLIQ
jgi:hypothetical protein